MRPYAQRSHPLTGEVRDVVRTISVGFGKVLTHDDKNEYLRRIMKVVHTVERVASPGSYLVDTFPSLMYLLKFQMSWPRSRANSGSSPTRS